MAKKKTNWLLWGGVGLGLWMLMKKSKTEKVVEAAVQNAAKAEAKEQAQSGYFTF